MSVPNYRQVGKYADLPLLMNGNGKPTAYNTITNLTGTTMGENLSAKGFHSPTVAYLLVYLNEHTTL
ncbi:MAG: hypothetical protein LBE12_11135 [Planctomycetaceae bacterium]|nr:hypothetical protein [Planctomycetaceae bacterium]